eukprot:5344778-Amphidinium_carterae.1
MVSAARDSHSFVLSTVHHPDCKQIWSCKRSRIIISKSMERDSDKPRECKNDNGATTQKKAQHIEISKQKTTNKRQEGLARFHASKRFCFNGIVDYSLLQAAPTAVSGFGMTPSVQWRPQRSHIDHSSNSWHQSCTPTHVKLILSNKRKNKK